MGKSSRSLNGIHFEGLAFAPPQVLGGVRLVPILRMNERQDLRLSRRVYGGGATCVQVDPSTVYSAFVPHGLVANWTNDGGAVFGSQLSGTRKQRDGRSHEKFATASGLRKMVRRESSNQLRMLPLHIALEGLLSLHFGGPSIAWTEYSAKAFRSGLSPRIESVIPGDQITGLDDALRLFEIHENQVGVLVFVAEALASAFLLPHHEDYVALHHTLISDFYGELIWHYGLYATENTIQPDRIDFDAIDSIDDLCQEVKKLRQRWSELSQLTIPGLSDASFNSELVYRFKPFRLERFISDLTPSTDNHLGEAIYADDGTLQYLKTYRMSAAQTRRAFLLSQLAACDWNLDECAAQLGCRKGELILRLENAGFGYLLHQHVLDGARAQETRRSD